MMLVSMKEMLAQARQNGYAVGAFEYWSYDSARCVVQTAECCRLPVILQVGHFERDYMGGYANAYRIAAMAAQGASVPVALHLDHCEDFNEIMETMECGFTSVMIDASARPYEENIELTRRVVRAAKLFGASVEAELGTLAGSEGGVSGTDRQTDPIQAAHFVEQTGVDALAVAIGTAHGFYTAEPHINVQRLKEIAAAVSIPLVLHGGSGTPEDKVRDCVRAGIAKVNICTEFIAAFAQRYVAVQQQEDYQCNVFGLFREAQLAAAELVQRKLSLFDPDRVLYRPAKQLA